MKLLTSRIFLAIAALSSGCATTVPDPTACLSDPQIRVREIGEYLFKEYRVADKPSRIIKVTPPQGLPFYLFDDDGDERIDHMSGDVPAPFYGLMQYTVRFEDYDQFVPRRRGD